MDEKAIKRIALTMAAEFRKNNVPRPWLIKLPEKHKHLQRIANEALCPFRKRMGR